MINLFLSSQYIDKMMLTKIKSIQNFCRNCNYWEWNFEL